MAARGGLARGDAGHVEVPLGPLTLQGNLLLPEGATGCVVFAHGSGSSRFSPRNRYVAEVVRSEGVGTFLLDLLTRDEEAVDARTGGLRFDIPFLASRVLAVLEWLRERPEAADLPIGLFGSSTGGGAALVAAAERPDLVGAVVSRGGRPDLAMQWLPRVEAPTLLLVGSEDGPVVAMNEDAYAHLACEKRLHLVEGATHLFEEPGALEEVARLAAEWFAEHLEAA